MPPLGLATGTSMNRPAHERHSAEMKGSPPVPHRQDGRGTGIGLIDRALADAAWTPSRSSFLVASRPSPGRRYVPSTSTYSTVPWRHSRPANSHEASFERPWASQVPSVTPQTHPRRMLSSILSCYAGNGNIWPSCARYRRRGARVLFCDLSALPKVRLGGERDACVRRRSHRHQPPERRPSHCRAVFHTPTSCLRFPADRLAGRGHKVNHARRGGFGISAEPTGPRPGS
jgi:hypothetical protein